jgi:hypothetical protein
MSRAPWGAERGLAPHGRRAPPNRGPFRASSPVIPVFKPILPRGHGLPCLIRGPDEAANPVFKPDRAPRPASPFWARKARMIAAAYLACPLGADRGRAPDGRRPPPNRGPSVPPSSRNPCVQADLAAKATVTRALSVPLEWPQSQYSSQIGPEAGKSFLGTEGTGNRLTSATTGGADRGSCGVATPAALFGLLAEKAQLSFSTEYQTRSATSRRSSLVRASLR